jgi:TPR repeat protein
MKIKRDKLMKTKTVFLLSIVIFLTCGCASKQAVGESMPQADGEDVIVSMISEDQELKSLFDKAATGDADAQYDFGSYYYIAGEVWNKEESLSDQGQQYYRKALQYFLKAAGQNHAEAQYNIGFMYGTGKGVPQDYKKAFKWYSKAAEQGKAYAQLNLGNMYYNGEGVPQDYQKAFEWFSKAAKQGDAKAQTNLGYLYERGQGVPQDYQKAFEWFSKAARQNNVNAQTRIGVLYYYGNGVPQDYKEAMQWYLKAAKQNYVDAQFNIGILYVNGQGVPQDYPKAFEWLSKSAEQEDIHAQYSLAGMYYDGKGIKQDLSKAFEWYEKAAKQGDKEAQAFISCYDKNMKMPQEHFNKCLSLAGQGSAQAQYAVGVLYAQELGVKKDLQKAYEWISKAAAQDSKYEESKKQIEEELAKISDKNGI